MVVSLKIPKSININKFRRRINMQSRIGLIAIVLTIKIKILFNLKKILFLACVIFVIM